MNIKLFQPTVSNFLIIVWLFIYCYFGHLITWKCEQVADFTYHSLFYKYPLDLRIFTLLFITRSQRPFYITGYKLTKCSLESYAKVSAKCFFLKIKQISKSYIHLCSFFQFMQTAVSFYMLFRNLSKWIRNPFDAQIKTNRQLFIW